LVELGYMKYQDRVYGMIEIDGPVILDLIKSPSLQRMKGIDQHGYFEPYFPGMTFKRFEHSIGVSILLKRFGASLKEQIAGLIHDVSHTVFSHVGDYIYGFETNQDFQDNYFEKFVKDSEIPNILKKYGIDYKYIVNEENFPLKERDLPDLCADRIDYFLRAIEITTKVHPKEINQFLNNLLIVDDFWVFKNKNLANKYALQYLEMYNWFWSGLISAVMFKTMEALLKYALNKKVITTDDLFTTEEKVWAKIRSAANEDSNLAHLLARADNKIKYKDSTKEDYDFYCQIKPRIVDPLFLENKKLKRVSEIDPEFFKLKEKYSKPKEYYIKFLERRN